MGCSSSREALGRVAPAPAKAERRQSLRSRTLRALASLGMCRRRRDDVVQEYVKLPLVEEVVKVSAGGSSVAEEGACVEDAASATSSWTAPWRAEPPTPSPPPVRDTADLDFAVLPGLQVIVEDYPPSHPALLYPEHACPVPPETTVVKTCDIVDDVGTPKPRDIPEVVTGIVRARVDEFHEQMEKKRKERTAADAEEDNQVATPRSLPALDDDVTPRSCPAARLGKPVVLYFTSLRGVRKTFEDGRAVRAILRCYRVRVDERDVSMHAAFKAELRALLGAGAPLPRVFVDDGRIDLGGAEDLRALHESGELARALAGCEAGSNKSSACAACGDARFAMCETCRGSCKVFVDDEGAGCRRLAGRFQRCPDCNENGLIRCPVCCY